MIKITIFFFFSFEKILLLLYLCVCSAHNASTHSDIHTPASYAISSFACVQAQINSEWQMLCVCAT